MHIHVQNAESLNHLPITQAQWLAAGIHGHHVTFGAGPQDFAAQRDTLEALISTPAEIKKLDLFSAKNLKLVQSTSAGVDALLPFDRIPPDVLLMNNRGTHALKAGEFALMAILMLVNNMPGFATAQRMRVWSRETAGLARDKRLTVVGLGSLGGAAAQQGRYLGMKVTGIRFSPAPHPECDVTLGLDALDGVLPQTDILLLACPLTPATTNLVSASRIALLPPGAGVINIGRGRLIEEAALFDALDDGRLGGAVLDVFHQEPLPAASRAWDVRNLVITPHMSSDDDSTYNDITLTIFAENLRAFEAGLVPPTTVDRAKGY